MRILHTADWHLGKLFYGQHLTEDQAHVIEHYFFPLLKEEKVDVILLAGDIFDRSVPPVEAVELWDDILTRTSKDYGIPFIVIGGNHDSAERLSLGRELFYKVQLYMEGGARRNHKAITLADAFGPIHICPIPFSEPHHLSQIMAKGEILTYEEAYRMYINAMVTPLPERERKIAVSHCFLTGGTICESERPLSIGGSDQVDKNIFKEFNYTALGHLHKYQTYKGEKGPIHYSGSLLKYSFSESLHKKAFTIVDMDDKGVTTLSAVPIVAKKDVRILRGTFQDIFEGTIYKSQAEEGLSYDDYIMAELTDEGPLIDAMSRLRQVYPHIRAINPIGRLTAMEEDNQITYKQLKEKNLFKEFAQSVWEKELSDEEIDYIQQVWKRSVEEGV